LCDFSLILNGRVPKDILSQFSYVDSIDAYHYMSKNNEKLFKTIYLYFRWGKLKRIELESYVYLQNNDLDYYKQERILEVCNSKYGKIETSSSARVYCTKPYTIPTLLEVNNYLRIKWKINGVTVELLYLPLESYNNLKNEMTDEVRIWYELNYRYE
jgi:hypothetical protein